MIHIVDELDNDGDRIVKLVTEDLDQLNIEINDGQPVTSEYVDGVMYYHKIQKENPYSQYTLDESSLKEVDHLLESTIKNYHSYLGFDAGIIGNLLQLLRNKGYIYYFKNGKEEINLEALKARLNSYKIIIGNPFIPTFEKGTFIGLHLDIWKQIFSICIEENLINYNGDVNIDEICKRLKQG